MNILITGGKGFIGSHLAENFIKEGHHVVVVDDESASENLEFYEFAGGFYSKRNIIDDPNVVNNHKLDPRIRISMTLRHLMQEHKIDVVLHHAARSRIQPSFSAPFETYKNNTMGTQAVLQAAVEASVKRVVYAGSSSCYGLINTPPLREDMSSDCLNHYAVSKKQGEEICKIYSRLYGIETVVLRYFNVYGPREPLKGHYAPVIGIFKQQRDAGMPLTIVGDGEQRRDFTYVSDIVDINRLAMTVDPKILYKGCDIPFDIFNTGNGVSYSVNEIAEMIGGNKSYIPARQGEARITISNSEKIKERLNWSPKVSLPDIITSY